MRPPRTTRSCMSSLLARRAPVSRLRGSPGRAPCSRMPPGREGGESSRTPDGLGQHAKELLEETVGLDVEGRLDRAGAVGVPARAAQRGLVAELDRDRPALE